ncbi:hypothetical protein BN159_0268 [Streptomyces davaonensis JCM 4913]|uniref:Uncharacterized protein n=1 Tax=Streptomyces davaonensis (strain DSM 101723 / JCM 4913 / KCC S-0913 / 768) TaxID=1214101 RepID=K4QUS8_STRDJ|nr:hypothetical protein [Streptomyces davaonensis]CCK24647.1 hypothetical protein BN159_0268 [Streptomyces davaonensis JCM 4913]
MATTDRDRPATSGDSYVVTTCGRRIGVRRLELAPAERPISRVALDVGRDQGGEPGVWAALTADEARDLARLLLLHAALAERGTEPVEATREEAPSP